MVMMEQETGRACKVVRCGDSRAGEGVAEPEVASEACKDGHASRDPLDALGMDIFQCQILALLDSRSLARSAAVSSRWRSLTTADKLWRPLVAAFVAQRAHLPLCLRGRDFSGCKGQSLVYAVVAMDSRQRDLVSAEMCGRTWEMRLKPTCGPYWLGYDPTQVGKPGLKRYFHCDGSFTNDPVRGGHSSVWEFTHLEGADGEVAKYVQILQISRKIRWPPLTPRRVKDGRWVLENFYGLYITRPDNPAFSTKRYSEVECKRPCRNSCTPPTYGVNL